MYKNHINYLSNMRQECPSFSNFEKIIQDIHWTIIIIIIFIIVIIIINLLFAYVEIVTLPIN